MSDRRRCAATTRRGEPCGMTPLTGSAYCYTHDPEHVADRAASRQSGGFNRRTAPGELPTDLSVRDVRAIQRQVEALLGATWEQENSARRTAALVGCYTLAVKLLETGELEARVRALEAAYRERRGLAAVG